MPRCLILPRVTLFPNMTSKLLFTEDGAGEHPGPTYLRDFAPVPLGKLMMLLITSKWNACLLHLLTWLLPPFKNYFAGPD